MKGFVKSEKVEAVLTAAYKSGQNVVLYGKGGYGKSEMAVAFLRSVVNARENQICVKSLSVGTTLDDLLGGINIKELKETGCLQYNVSQSVFSAPFLILEEAFDAPVRVLEGLKDILTSGKIRNGLQTYKVQTKFIIVCTNRSKSELVEDESTAALMERFPLSYKVEWDSHSLADYQRLIKTVICEEINEEFEALLSYILESIKEDQSKAPPCPRTVIRAYKIHKAAGVEALQFLDGLPNIERALSGVKEALKVVQKKKQLVLKLDELWDYKILRLSEESSWKVIQEYITKVKALKDWAGSDLVRENERAFNRLEWQV
jgi:MoxR-like ATPase